MLFCEHINEGQETYSGTLAGGTQPPWHWKAQGAEKIHCEESQDSGQYPPEITTKGSMGLLAKGKGHLGNL